MTFSLSPPAVFARCAATGWLCIAVFVACGIFTTTASANCVLIGLGSATSLLTCTGGVRGTVIGLGNGLASYHFSSGSSGMIHLATAATGADAVPSPAAATPLGATVLPGASSSQTPTSSQTSSSQNLAVSSGPTIAFLISGAGGTPKSGAPPMANGGTGIKPLDPMLLNAPLTPAMKTVANSALAPPPRAPPMPPAMSANTQ
jgi:hypothetical protein